MFSAGLLNKRILVLNRSAVYDDGFGMQGGDYLPVRIYHASVAYVKGTRALRAGSVDAYDTLLIRTRYHEPITRDSRIEYDGKTYQIMSLNADRQADEMQMTVQEIKEPS